MNREHFATFHKNNATKSALPNAKPTLHNEPSRLHNAAIKHQYIPKNLRNTSCELHNETRLPNTIQPHQFQNTSKYLPISESAIMVMKIINRIPKVTIYSMNPYNGSTPTGFFVSKEVIRYNGKIKTENRKMMFNMRLPYVYDFSTISNNDNATPVRSGDRCAPYTLIMDLNDSDGPKKWLMMNKEKSAIPMEIRTKIRILVKMDWKPDS